MLYSILEENVGRSLFSGRDGTRAPYDLKV